ncbi:outer membrane lipoprotein carrier protein LolA [Streptomyces sp. NPDC049040]|uniref:LolA family protein n=1 Tax=Streptomyces sp. NPDC049040 TaxID=3365593 RepID=UPI003720D56D
MALIQPAQPEAHEPEGGQRRRKALRYAVPVAVVGVTAATIGLVPALADSGDPSLPSLTAQQILTRIAASDTQTVDGTVKISTDLGLPSALSGGTASGMFGGAAAPPAFGSPDGSRADPQRQFTQLLIGSHTLHVAADGQDRQKVSIIEPAAEYSVIHNGSQVWAYDSSSNEAYHSTLPARDAKAQSHRQLPDDFPSTPQAAAEQIIKASDGTASFTADGTARVAGRSAYVLLIRPQNAPDTTIDSIRIAVDSKTGVPLKFTLQPKGNGKAAFEAAYTKVSFGKPAASTFTFTPPKGVKVTEESDKASKDSSHAPMSGLGEPSYSGSGWDTVAVFKSKGALPSDGHKNHKGGPADMLGGFGKQVSGAFGSGTLFHTRLVNVLLTQDGSIYAGAVDQSALTAAANSAAR